MPGACLGVQRADGGGAARGARQRAQEAEHARGRGGRRAPPRRRQPARGHAQQRHARVQGRGALAPPLQAPPGAPNGRGRLGAPPVVLRPHACWTRGSRARPRTALHRWLLCRS